MNKQLKLIRRYFQKTQNEFGKSLGVSRDTYASYESGRVVPNDTFVRLLCSVYNINESWLLTEHGEMLKENKSTFMDSLKVRFSLDDIDVEIVSMYLETPPEYRKMFKAYVKGLVETGYNQYIKENPNKSNKMTSDIDIEKEVENYRKELEAEKRVMEKSSALPTAKDA